MQITDGNGIILGDSALRPLFIQMAAGSGAVATTGTPSSVASSATSVTVLAANTNRKSAVITNESTAILYLLVGAGTASATNYTYSIPATATTSSSITISGYTGIVSGAWASANGFARVTEYT